MFKKGDIIVYPPYGLGYIVGISDREIDGQQMSLYQIRLQSGRSIIHLPIENAEKIGVRKLITKTLANKFLRGLTPKSVDLRDNWNQRYRENLAKLKSNDLMKIKEVIEELAYIQKVRGLSTRDKEILIQAIKLVAAEISFVLNKDIEQVMKTLKRKLGLNKAYDEGGDIWF